MTQMSRCGWSGPAILALTGALWLAVPATTAAQSARALYEQALSREQAARAAATATPATLRAIARAYEVVVLRHPTSGYCDNALWQAAGLMQLAWERSRDDADRAQAVRYLAWLRREYPHSALAGRVAGRLTALEPAPNPPSQPAQPSTRPAPAEPAAARAPAALRRVTRSPLPRGDRIVVEFSAEVAFAADRLADPDRVFVDFQSSRPAAGLPERLDTAAGTLVRDVRVGRHPDDVTRVVLELAGAPRFSVYPVYDPFRVVIDLESDALPPAVDATPVATPPPPAAPQTAPPAVAAPPGVQPAPPATTSRGNYSLARQLGLGVSRIVIDPGHGGHDPGAQANGVVEAELVLDIAKRVEALLRDQPDLEIVLTRNDNTFIPLEERTAVANREDADLFVSIHANASRQTATRGVETYVLNFATNPEAEAVAARENAGSARSMGTLPDLTRAILLNNKLAESRELATMVQTALVRSLRAQSAAVKDLGVKQAPFVVLIGAEMPSVLVEVSFLTNRAEAALLRDNGYRQRIAQALADAILKYRASLKRITTVASRDESR